MALDWTQNPLYRRVYGQNNPLMPQQSWQPPSEYVPRINYAAQDVNNLLGNFFAQNSASYTPQPQPMTQTYQTTPQGYTAYQPTLIRNDNPNAWQDLQNGAGALFDKYVTPQLAQDVTYTAGVGMPLAAAIKNGRGLAVPYTLAALGATKYGFPIADTIRKFGETPVGKFADKALDKVINLFW